MSLLSDFLARRRARQGLVRAEAIVLLVEHGRSAYRIARQRARAERQGQSVEPSLPPGAWDQVRREIARIEGRL